MVLVGESRGEIFVRPDRVPWMLLVLVEMVALVHILGRLVFLASYRILAYLLGRHVDSRKKFRVTINLNWIRFQRSIWPSLSWLGDVRIMRMRMFRSVSLLNQLAFEISDCSRTRIWPEAFSQVEVF